jgi:pyruvate,water dikinase
MSVMASFDPILTAQGAATLAPSRLGGKAANLVRLAQAGFEVPRWSVVPTDVFVETLRSSGLQTEIDHLLASLDPKDGAQIRQASDEIGDRLRHVMLPDALRAAIETAWQRDFAGGLVAVRSSAVGEDSATQSFAGQMDTFLFVTGVDGILEAIRGCWASAFSERALSYRVQNGLGLGDIRLAVVIQEMVFGKVSGVLFTANPISGKWDEAVLSATYGLGEGLVSGELDADNWIVQREPGAIAAEIATKREQIVLDESRGHGTSKVAVPEGQQAMPSLTDDQIREVLGLGDRISAHFGSPQDIEWTLREGTFTLLQTRPITNLKPPLRGKRRLWDNSNIAESYYGVTTPLTFSFVNRMYEVAYQVMFDAFGVPHRVLRDHAAVFANLLGLLNGRIFYNLDNYYRIITFFPAYDVLKDFFDTMIGVQEKKDYEKTSASMFERLFVAAPQIARLVSRIWGNFLDWDRDVERFRRHFTTVFEEYRGRDYAAMDPDTILDAYRDIENRLLWQWRAPMTNDFYAMVFYGLLKKLTALWKVDETGSLQNDLLCGEGGLESTEPAKAIIRLAIAVRSDPSLVDLFTHTPESEIRRALEAEPFAGFRARFEDYLHRFGYRCMGELKLEVKNLQEDPSFVFSMIKNYLSLASLDLGEMESRERVVREGAEREAFGRLSGRPWRRWIYRWVLENARKGVRNRENLRMARTRAFGLVREVFQGLGVQLHALGHLENPDDVFYLDFHDLFSFVEGRSTCTNLRALAALRREEFARFEAAPVDDRLVTTGAVYVGDQLHDSSRRGSADDDAPVLQGISCCPGQVAARVRVILSPDDDLRLHGEILVTERTDPGWVPLYPSASGLLIERGSLLSHAAVVAREMGLPTVIGVKNLIRRVQDGQWVEMDGRAGTVRLDAAPPDGAG